MKKKFGILAITAGILITSPFGNVQGAKAASGWQEIGNGNQFSLNVGESKYDGWPLMKYNDDKAPKYLSGGGNFKVSITANGKFTIVVKEHDPGSNADETIATKSVSGSNTYVFDVRDYVDGDNGKAEIYVKFYKATGKSGITTHYYD